MRNPCSHPIVMTVPARQHLLDLDFLDLGIQGDEELAVSAHVQEPK